VEFYFIIVVLLNIKVLNQRREYRFSYSHGGSEAIAASILMLVKMFFLDYTEEGSGKTPRKCWYQCTSTHGAINERTGIFKKIVM